MKALAIAAVAGLILTACGTRTQEIDVADVGVADPQPISSSSVVTNDRSSASLSERLSIGEKEFVEAVGGDRIFFGFDSASLSEEAQLTLQKAADYIKTYNPQAVTIEGHCDERGTREYNLALGDRRAVAVKKYLVGLGVPASKLTTISYGKERPAAPGHTEAAWSQNRRAVLVLEQ